MLRISQQYGILKLVSTCSHSGRWHQVRIGKGSGSSGISGATESWIPSRALGYFDDRLEKFKIAMVEFAAHSDMKRRLTLGLWCSPVCCRCKRQTPQ